MIFRIVIFNFPNLDLPISYHSLHNLAIYSISSPPPQHRQQLRREERIRRLQEQQDAAAAVAAEKQREKEEKERKERIQDYDDFLAGKGYKPKSKYGTGNTSSNEENADPPSPPSLLTNRPRPRLRNDDYNPMMGSGGSGGYRPAPRGGAGGGG